MFSNERLTGGKKNVMFEALIHSEHIQGMSRYHALLRILSAFDSLHRIRDASNIPSKVKAEASILAGPRKE